jgi:hypothetical protein
MIDKSKQYLRIGTTYYKIVQFPSINGQLVEILIRWDKNTIIQDHNRDCLSKIPKYDGSVCYPNHINFSKEIKGFYNTYSQLKYRPIKGEIENTLKFFNHIFGEQIEIGLDYLKILYEYPLQILPILCLVSNERATGKSTFLKYLKEVFSNNMSYLDSHSLNSNFNLDWGNKLILGLDEAFFQKEEIIERIKYLSTSDKNKIEAKGKEKVEVEFFGKFVMCSNKEDSFIKIDADEIRFWIRKVPKIIVEDIDLMKKLVSEIPAFLYFILNRKFATERKTRMWFTRKQIYTPALAKLIKNSRNQMENEIASIFISIMDKLSLDEVKFVTDDILSVLLKRRFLTNSNELRKVFKVKWKLPIAENSLSYKKVYFHTDGDITMATMSSKARYFTITKEFLQDNFDELMS